MLIINIYMALFFEVPQSISSGFSRNSEADASEFLEN